MTVVLTHFWACLQPGCLEHGTGPGSDRAAERHGKAFQHPTHTWAVPKETPA